MHSLLNLRGIPNSTRFPIGAGPNEPSLRLHDHITSLWTKKFKEWSDNGYIPSLQDLKDFAKQIDDEFGEYFQPPIR